MFKRTLALAIALAAPVFVHSAFAGELTMYEGAGFQGRSITLRDEARDLNRTGFNDRTSSMVVRSGRWQICEHANFEGRCGIFDAGEYAQLERDRLGDTISSAREVGGESGGGARRDRDYGDGRDGRDGYRDGAAAGDVRDERRDERRELRRERRERRGAAQVELFTGAEFSGERIVVQQDQLRSLRERSFNDRARSVVVRGGQWQFCKHDDFGGECVVYGPGEYPHLGRLSRQISSIRQVR